MNNSVSIPAKLGDFRTSQESTIVAVQEFGGRHVNAAHFYDAFDKAVQAMWDAFRAEDAPLSWMPTHVLSVFGKETWEEFWGRLEDE